MSPAVPTNNTFPAGCVPGGIMAGDVDGGWKMPRITNIDCADAEIDKPWLEEEKVRWSTWCFVHSLIWLSATHVRLFLSNIHTGLHDEITELQTLTQHIHRCKQSQLNTHSHMQWFVDVQQMRIMFKHTRSFCNAALSFTMTRWPFEHILHGREHKEVKSGGGGMKKDYRAAPLIKWKKGKNYIR